MTTKRDLALIVHVSRAELPEIRHLVEWVRGKGHTVRPRVTWEPGDGREFAREMAERGVDTIVACGGDGMINEVVNGLDGHDVPLGIIPIGTANDFARQIGLPMLDPDHSMDVILQRPPRRIDTASLNGRRYLNVSTAGVGAEATAETPAEAKEALGPLAYAITGLRKLKDLEAQPARFVAPGVDFDTTFLVLAVGNARATGGGTLLTPQASVTDGELDVCIVEGMPRSDFARLALRMKKGDHLENDGVRYIRVPWLRVEAEDPISVNVDGEPMQARELRYEARPGDLQLHVIHLPGEPEESAESAGG